MRNVFLKFKILICLGLFSFSMLSANQDFCSELLHESAPCCFSEQLLEIKMGYFTFSNSKLRKVYNKGGLDIQLSLTYPLWNLSTRWTLNAYSAVEYFQRSGRSLNGHQKTSVWSVPINLGLKPIYAINNTLHYFLAVGPRFFNINQRNHSSYVYKNRSKNNLGFFVNTGFNYALTDCLMIDIFGEYTYAKVHFHSGIPGVYTRSIQAGGFTIGGGLRYEF